MCDENKINMTVEMNKIQKIKGIQRTETFISLEESIERPLNVDH